MSSRTTGWPEFQVDIPPTMLRWLCNRSCTAALLRQGRHITVPRHWIYNWINQYHSSIICTFVCQTYPIVFNQPSKIARSSALLLHISFPHAKRSAPPPTGANVKYHAKYFNPKGMCQTERRMPPSNPKLAPNIMTGHLLPIASDTIA